MSRKKLRPDDKRIDVSLVQPRKHPPQFSIGRTLYLALFMVSLAVVAAFFAFRKQGNDAAHLAAHLKVDHGDFVSVPEADISPSGSEPEVHDVSMHQEQDKEDEQPFLLNNEGMELFRKRMYEDAAVRFEDALELSPGNEVILKNIAVSRLMTGWESFKKGVYNEAIESFGASLRISPTAEAYKGIGMSYMNTGDHTSALESMKSALAINNDDISILMMTGRILYRENRLEDAGYYFESVLRAEPSNVEAGNFLAKIKREEMEDNFREKGSSHFYVRYEGGEQGETGYLISMVLEEAYYKVGVDLNHYPKDMITAILYTKKQFMDVTRSPSWSGGLYDGKIRLPSGSVNRRTDDLVRVVFHEYTHALIHRMTSGNCPAWLNEGIAQYEEGIRSVDMASELAGSVGRLVPLKNLEMPFADMDASSASAAYAMSLLAVDYIVSEFSMHGIQRILENLADGLGWEEAVSSAIYLSYEDIEKGVRNRI